MTINNTIRYVSSTDPQMLIGHLALAILVGACAAILALLFPVPAIARALGWRPSYKGEMYRSLWVTAPTTAVMIAIAMFAAHRQYSATAGSEVSLQDYTRLQAATETMPGFGEHVAAALEGDDRITLAEVPALKREYARLARRAAAHETIERKAQLRAALP